MGESKITLIIADKIPINQAINQVRDLIIKNRSLLPEGAKDPIVSTESFSNLPMMYIGLMSNNSLPSADEIDLIKEKLKYVDEVASVSSFGITEKAVYINIDPVKLAKYHNPLENVLASLTLQSSNFSGGKLSNQYKTEYISFDSVINKISDFDNISLDSNNVAVKLKMLQILLFRIKKQQVLHIEA